MLTDIVVVAIKDFRRDVFVEFNDGHRAEFSPYSHGFGSHVEGLREFKLFNGDECVCKYMGRLSRVGPTENEYRITFIAEGYTQQRVSLYWRAASDYIHLEYFQKPYNSKTEGPKELWYPWVVIKAGWQDLPELEKGRANLLS